MSPKYCFILLSFNVIICIDGVQRQYKENTYQDDSTEEEFKIVGGEVVDIKEVPYQVSIHVTYKGEEVFHCGGSIIAPDIILTAAHCVDGHGPETFHVRAGSSLNYMAGVLMKVTRTRAHPDFSHEKKDKDVGLMWLAERLQYGPTIQPIKMAAKGSELPPGSRVLVTGWGRLSDGGPNPPDSLRQVVVPGVSAQCCRDHYPHSITSYMLCAGGEGKGVCYGDSGGPLVHSGVQHGIVSWGWRCAGARQPGVFARVAALRSWIDDTIQGQNEQLNQIRKYCNNFSSPSLRLRLLQLLTNFFFFYKNQ